MYVLTTGAVGAGKEYLPFDITKLKDTDLDASGALLKGRLFVGSVVPSDRVCGVQRVPAPKFLVRTRTGSRAIGKANRPIYVSFSALVDKHRKRIQAVSAGTPFAPSTLADKGRQVHAFAGIFASAAAVAQAATKQATASKDAPDASPAASPVKVSTPADAPADPWVLQMPALTPAKGTYEELRRAQLSLSDLRKAQMRGEMVSESVVDVLTRYEERIFEEQADKCGLRRLVDATTVVRICDSAFLVHMAKKHGAAHLAAPRLSDDELASLRLADPLTTSAALQDGRGYYGHIVAQLGLASAKESKVLVALHVPANKHFAEAFWLPQTDEVVLVDSHRASGLAAVTEAAIVPFAEFVTGYGLGALVTKDDRNGIACQASSPVEEANVCGFATPLFLSKALRALLEIGQQVDAREPLDLPTIGAALAAELKAMTVATSSIYTARRSMGKKDLAHLEREYKEIRITREAAKAKEAAMGEEGEEEELDDLHTLLRAKREREEKAAAMKAAITKEMEAKMDVGIRVNQQLVDAWANCKRQRMNFELPSDSEPPSDSESSLQLSSDE